MAASGRHVSKILWAYIIELPQLVGGGGLCYDLPPYLYDL